MPQTDLFSFSLNIRCIIGNTLYFVKEWKMEHFLQTFIHTPFQAKFLQINTQFFQNIKKTQHVWFVHKIPINIFFYSSNRGQIWFGHLLSPNIIKSASSSHVMIWYQTNYLSCMGTCIKLIFVEDLSTSLKPVGSIITRLLMVYPQVVCKRKGCYFEW